MSGGTANKIAKPKAPPGLEDFGPDNAQENQSEPAQTQASPPPQQRQSPERQQSNQQPAQNRASQQPSPQRQSQQPSPQRQQSPPTRESQAGRTSPQQRQRQHGTQPSARFQAAKQPGLQSMRQPLASQVPMQQMSMQPNLAPRSPSPQQSQPPLSTQHMYGSMQQTAKQPYGGRSPTGPDSLNQGYSGTSGWYGPRSDAVRPGTTQHSRMPEQMLPPGLAHGQGTPPMMGPSIPQHQGAYSRHFAEAISGSLQKFSFAEALHKAADARGITPELPTPQGQSRPAAFMKSYGSTPTVPMYDELDQRMQAQAQAARTAARLVEQGYAVAPRSTSSTQAKEEAPNSVSEDGEKRYTGRVRSFNVGQGFGFIESAEVAKIHGCDVFLNQAVEGGVVVGSIVSFTVERNKKGKPQARRVVCEDKSTAKPTTGPKPHEELAEKVRGIKHQSKVKSFNTSRGFGFIATPLDLQYSFGGRDIYVSKNQTPEGGLFVGQDVEYKLIVDPQGQPQARDVRVLPRNRGLELPYTGLPFA